MTTTTDTKKTTKKPAAKPAAKKPATRKATARKPVPATPTGDAGAPLQALVGDLPSGPRMVDVDRLVPHPRNPRTAMDPDDLQALADSIRAQGVRQNLLVVPDPGEEGRHMIVIGHRRAQAARMAGLEQVPAVVDPTLTEAQQLELMLVENMQRSDLTVVEEADGYQGLLDLGLTQAQMAKSTGVSKTKVSSRLKLAAQPAEVKSKVAARQATLEDAERLAAFADTDAYPDLLASIGTTTFGWKIQQEEQRVKIAAKRAENVARAKELGVTILANSFDSLPAGSRSWYGPWPSPRVSDEDLTREGVYAIERQYSDELEVYGPPRTDDDPASEAAQAAREAAERALAEAIAAVQTAANLRTEFLLARTSGKVKFTQPQADSILTFYLRLIVGDDYASVVDPPTPGDFHAWAGSDSDDLDGRTTGQILLALAACQVEGGPDDEASRGGYWYESIRTLFTARTDDSWKASPVIVAWYALLEQLGYEPSPWERDRLAGKPLDEDAEAES